MAASRRVVAIAVPAVLAASATAFAALTGPPSAEQVGADFVFEHAVIKERDCTGAGGHAFAEQVVTATGRSTGDPRLTGDITYQTRLLVNLDTGDGVDVAKLRIRTSGGGGWKAQGNAWTAGIEEIGQGIVVGETRDPATSSGDRLRLFGGLRITFNENGSVVGQIGGDVGDGRLPAIAIGGSCSGPYESFEVDLPGPDDPPAPGAKGRSRVGWR